MANPFPPTQRQIALSKAVLHHLRPPTLSRPFSCLVVLLSSQQRSLPKITVVICVRVYGLPTPPSGCQNTAHVLALSHPYSPLLPQNTLARRWSGGLEKVTNCLRPWEAPICHGHRQEQWAQSFQHRLGIWVITQLKSCNLSREPLCQWIPARKTDKSRKCYLPSLNAWMGVEVHITWRVFLVLGWS